MEVGSLKIHVVRKDIRNIHLSVYPPTGSVRVATPRNVNDDTLRLFVVSKIGWIRRQQRRFQKQEREGIKEYVERESHNYLGKRYLLKVKEKHETYAINVGGRFLVMTVRPGTTRKRRQELLDHWYRQQLAIIIEPMIEKWEKKIGVKASGWSIRKMRTKWGSCNTDSKRLCFNSELAKKPIECIEYVVVHELVHLRERRHGERFEMLMNQWLTSWPHARQLLQLII